MPFTPKLLTGQLRLSIQRPYVFMPMHVALHPSALHHSGKPADSLPWARGLTLLGQVGAGALRCFCPERRVGVCLECGWPGPQGRARSAGAGQAPRRVGTWADGLFVSNEDVSVLLSSWGHLWMAGTVMELC